MLARMLKQLLFQGGFDDPDGLAMIDALFEGEFVVPTMEVLAGGSFNIGEGSKAMAVSTSNPNDDFTLVIIRRKKK